MIAIDLGTSNSSVAVYTPGGGSQMIPLEFGDPQAYTPYVMPSAVCICGAIECRQKSVVFGHEATRHTFNLSHDSKLLQEMKIYFDRATANAPTLVQRQEVVLLREENGFLTPVRKVYLQPHWEGNVPLEPKDFVPGTAKLVKELIKKAVETGADKSLIAVGYPASFHGTGVRRLREAVKLGAFGESADYSGVRLYPEPLAAARAYMGIQAGNFLVLDYGGGTLDVTTMKVTTPGVFEQKNVYCSGFPEGGARMDEAILNYSLAKGGTKLQDWYQQQPLRTKLRIKSNVESVKIALSTSNEATVEFPGSKIDPVRLTPGELAHALQPIMTRMVAKVMETIMRGLGGIEDVQFVVMSGGSSLSPVVQNSVLAMFQHIPEDRFIVPAPDNLEQVETCMCAVAKGLALLSVDGFEPPAIPAD
jgi:molecular chaperone DnaK (HSP70)